MAARDEGVTPSHIESPAAQNGSGKTNGKNGHGRAGTGGRRARRAAPKTVSTQGLTIPRRWTEAGKDPFEQVEWEHRTAVISGEKGEVVFEQKDVEVPKSWSQLATNVVASKYFRGPLGDPGRERSARQLIGRVAFTIAGWGRDQGYFASEEDSQAFQDELVHLLLHQKASFNSPVWFNCGIEPQPQCSACFINSVEDNMESILRLAATEARLFKGGSGTGSNLSAIRGSMEQLRGGGQASGPVSFMRGYDAFAGVIKCLTPDAYVYTDSGLRTIGDVVPQGLEPGFHPDESVVLATRDTPTRISQVYVSPEAETYRLRLQHTGLTLRGTGEHPVLTLTPEFRLEWKCLSDLRRGDRVAVSRGEQLWPEQPPAFSFQPVTRAAKKVLSYPSQMTPELARLLGYLVSEGSLDSGRFRFSNADTDTFEDFLRCVRTVFQADPTGNVRQRTHPRTGVVTWQFEACWANAVRFLQHIGLEIADSAGRRVPWSVLQSPKALVIEFLRAYFEGDGHVSTHVFASSASGTLLQEVQLLLLNLGMLPQLRPHRVAGKEYWCLALRGEQAWIFVREVGFVSARKREAAHLAGDKNTNIDVVPFLVDVLRARASRNGYFRCEDGITRLLRFGFFNRKVGSGISYDRLRCAPSLLSQVRAVDPELGETLEAVLEKQFFWDCVESVEAAGPAVTYDFTVPGTHSFVANGIVNHNSGGKTRRAAKMVILNIDHPDIVEFIKCKGEEEKKAWALIDAGYDGGFNVPGGAYSSIFFQNANHSVRVTDEFMRAVEQGGDWQTRAVLSGRPVDTYKAPDLLRMIAEYTHICGDPGLQFDTTINDWHTCPNTARINASNPCSEYMFLDDSACNLASLNLLKFRTPQGQFDPVAFEHACHIVFLAQEIIVDNASYPTPAIEVNSHAFRPLGLGYANLGALLMAAGVPYDSDEGRAYAASVTALMTGAAYRMSARVAAVKGPFSGYAINREPFLRVMRKHREAVSQVDSHLAPTRVLNAAARAWDEAIAVGEEHGFRNAQATVLAPTGTIGFMMDCDTTGIEPDIALVKYKKLVGGGVMKIVNQTVPEALKRLGYEEDEVSEIVTYVDEKDTIEGAPYLRDEDLPVFDCAFRATNGTRSIEPMGHIRMMAAAQPFLSGAISKTVNVPADASIEDIQECYLQAWKLGLKAVAIYRDGSKRTQPLNTSLKGEKALEGRPIRRKLPPERQALTHKFTVAGHEGYITVGLYEDGTPGEVFLVMSKEGSVISGLMDSFATAVSLALQYGVPLKELVKKFSHVRFEPAGFTGNPDLPIAKSIVDYIFRWMGLKFLAKEDRPAPEQTLANGGGEGPTGGHMVTPAEERQVFQLQADAPPCSECGALMVRNGACYKCLNCGSTYGCS